MPMPANDPSIVMRYVAASRGPGGPLVAIQQDLPKMIVTREAAFPVEYGVKGRELQDKIAAGARSFIRAMELQGLELIPLPTGNPQVVTDKYDNPYGTYSITHDLDKPIPDELADARDGGGPPTFQQPQSLEDSKGMVDYRIVGVFWAPQVAVEIAKERSQLLAEERAAKNPLDNARERV